MAYTTINTRSKTDIIIRSIFKILIKLYQLFLSPILALLGVSCRFYPSCSCYASECFEKHTWMNALIKTTRRLSKCGPWHPGGIDLP